MTLAEKIVKHLKSTPNGMDSDWGILWAVFPDAKQGDKANGGRMACIRKEARKNKGFCILPKDADMIALIR